MKQKDFSIMRLSSKKQNYKLFLYLAIVFAIFGIIFIFVQDITIPTEKVFNEIKVNLE